MRRLLYALGLMLLVSIASAQPLVPNAGFETGSGDKPDNWSWRADEGATGTFEWVTAPVHGGQRAFRVARHGAGGFTALDSGYIPVEVGKTYRVSAWIFPQRPVRRGVYFMVTQHTANSDADQLPNTFGTTTARFIGQT